MVAAIKDEVWEVVGGTARGGIVVRMGKELTSPKVCERLAAGAMVKVLKSDSGRLHYELLSGSGPTSGWVATCLQGKSLLKKASRVQHPPTKEETAVDMGPRYTAMVQGSAADESEALRKYGQRFKQAKDAKKHATPPQPILPYPKALFQLPSDGPSPVRVRAELEHRLGLVVSCQQSEDCGPTQEPVEEVLVRGRPRRDFSNPGALRPTFGYAASLCEHPPFARFDVRDEVCVQVGGFRHGQVVRDRHGSALVVVGVKLSDGKPRLWFHPKALQRPAAGTFPGASAAALQARLSVPVQPRAAALEALREVSPEELDAMEDSDGEEVLLCCECRLPVGGCSYYANDRNKHRVVHGDCWPKFISRREQTRRKEQSQLKVARRSEYKIGWTTEHIPRSVAAAERLGCPTLGHGLCCLVWQGGGRPIRVAPTVEPAAAVNLEYLSIALQVRLKEGREPRFSLDPIAPASPYSSPKFSTQVKRYDPAWLAGTSVGDVLFQADYLLKELSMGEYSQPVLGMRSCFSQVEADKEETEWRAREWFVVKKAEVQLSEDGALIPSVKLGVEAREQVMTEAGSLEDAAITRPDHPLVKYAEEFTHNFDLIAERTSAFYHLRELAKAAVLAKFLLEAQVPLEDSWFHAVTPADVVGEGPSEIPQLWKEHYHPRIRIEEGKIAEEKNILGRPVRQQGHSVYGGVNFNLELFRAYWGEPVPTRGVDLNLDHFELAPCCKAPAGEATHGLPQVHASTGAAFWEALSHSPEPSIFSGEDQQLLRSVFNPHLSDRKMEGSSFVPPGTSSSYMEELRKLVKEEDAVRQARKQEFLSSSLAFGALEAWFLRESAPDLHGWSSQAADEDCELCSHPEYKSEALLLEERVMTTIPIHDHTAEDGTRFRVYECGQLQVRTVHDHGGEEAIGAVFSIRERGEALAEARCTAPSSSESHVKIARVAEYVEKGARCTGGLDRHSFVVFKTAEGDCILTELLADGIATWEENPSTLQGRTSRARVVRSAVAGEKVDVCVRDVRNFHRYQGALYSQPGAASASQRKRYAQCIYNRGVGDPNRMKSGFCKTLRRTRCLSDWLSDSKAAVPNRSEKPMGEEEERLSKEQYQELGAMMRLLLASRGDSQLRGDGVRA